MLMVACLPITFAVLRSQASSPENFSSDQIGTSSQTPISSLVGVEDNVLQNVPLAANPQHAAIRSSGLRLDWQPYAPHATTIYFVGVVGMLMRLLLALRGGQRLRRDSDLLDDPPLLAVITQQAQLIGLRFTPVVAYCKRVAAPVVVGVLKPTILLPFSLTGLTSEQLRAILTHELAHICRYDHLVNLLQRVVESALFFHPGV